MQKQCKYTKLLQHYLIITFKSFQWRLLCVAALFKMDQDLGGREGEGLTKNSSECKDATLFDRIAQREGSGSLVMQA